MQPYLFWSHIYCALISVSEIFFTGIVAFYKNIIDRRWGRDKKCSVYDEVSLMVSQGYFVCGCVTCVSIGTTVFHGDYMIIHL